MKTCCWACMSCGSVGIWEENEEENGDFGKIEIIELLLN